MSTIHAPVDKWNEIRLWFYDDIGDIICPIQLHTLKEKTGTFHFRLSKICQIVSTFKSDFDHFIDDWRKLN